MSARFLPHLLLLVLLSVTAAADTTPSPPPKRQVRVVSLLLPEQTWSHRTDAILTLLQPLAADLVIAHDVSSDTSAGPAACLLARRLRMHCDFVTPDPPSTLIRRGTALLSARPLLADGVTLLHGDDRVPPVAAGFLRLDVDGLPVDVYVASLAPGSNHRPGRLRQAGDLRRWMESQRSALQLVAANFGASGKELQGLMPGLKPSRNGSTKPAADVAHGLDLLFPPRCRLLESRVLQLSGVVAMAQPAGLLVELQLPDQATEQMTDGEPATG